jgi:hypothetical protein
MAMRAETTGDIGDFLFARIADDEREAERDRYSEAWLGGPFCAARVVQDCDVRRRLIKEHSAAGWPQATCASCVEQRASPPAAAAYPCATLRLLCLPYRHHRDYDAAWSI